MSREGPIFTVEDNAAGQPLDIQAALEVFFEEFPDYEGRIYAAPVMAKPPRGMQHAVIPDTTLAARHVKAAAFGLALTPNSSYPLMKSTFNDTEMWHRYMLDRALGRAMALLDDPDQSENKAQCAGDAYAVIRHYQHYGENSTFPDYIRDLRNMQTVHTGDPQQWTARAVDTVIKMNKKGSIAGLAPEQARNLAVKISGLTHLSADAEANIRVAFQPVAQSVGGMAETERPLEYMALTAALGATTESAAVYEICFRFTVRFAAYVPPNLPSKKTPDELKGMALNLKTLRGRKPEDEPKPAAPSPRKPPSPQP